LENLFRVPKKSNDIEGTDFIAKGGKNFSSSTHLTLGHWSVQERLAAFSSSLLAVNWKHLR
jgi:hypothetical protein